MLHKDSVKFKQLIEAFTKAEETVKSVLLKTNGKSVEDYEFKVNKKLDKVKLELTKKSIDWAEKDMPEAYQNGVKSVDKGTTKTRLDGTDIENAYIGIAQNIQYATSEQIKNIQNAIERAEKENSYGATVDGVKKIIEEELAKDNETLTITYSNGAKHKLSQHAEMLARTSRIISANTGAFNRCGELGIDLVRCTTVPDCCPYCKKYEGKVYSLSGNDKRFPSLYDTALQKGYNIMHPNCRHEFIPFVEDMNTKEELEKIIKDSNHFEELSKDDKLFKIYNRNQALNRQWVDESREYHRLKNALGDKFPYKTLGGFKRARRSGTLEYHNIKKLARDLTKSKEFNIINTGARVKTQKEQDKHAINYYGLVRKMKTDVEAISKNTGLPKQDIQRIKNYVFIDKHDFMTTKDKRFIPDFDMAQSWQRLFEGKNILPQDIVLLKHELLEIKYIEQGESQENAHILASKDYNYQEALDNYVDGTTKKGGQ